jgi:hypothetical protein
VYLSIYIYILTSWSCTFLQSSSPYAPRDSAQALPIALQIYTPAAAHKFLQSAQPCVLDNCNSKYLQSILLHTCELEHQNVSTRPLTLHTRQLDLIPPVVSPICSRQVELQNPSRGLTHIYLPAETQKLLLSHPVEGGDGSKQTISLKQPFDCENVSFFLGKLDSPAF